MSDFDNPELGPLLEKYMSTGSEVSGEYRARRTPWARRRP
jgi:aromatic ring hydroxylase